MSWVKIAGGAKASGPGISMSIARLGSSILEVGAYCGHSSTRMAMAILTEGIFAMEVDPVHVLIARSAVAFGGLHHALRVWAGHSAWLSVVPRVSDPLWLYIHFMIYID